MANEVDKLPSVTVAIPTFNRVEYLEHSLGSALNQTYPNLSVFVSDNASDDRTLDFLRSVQNSRFSFVRQTQNLGMMANWNACLRAARGDFFLLLPDDDLLEPEAVDRLARAMVNSPDSARVGAAYCRTWEVDATLRRRQLDPPPPAYENARSFALQYFAGRRKFHPGSTLFRTADFREFGGFEEGDTRLAADSIACSRALLMRGFIVGVDEALANYRVHPATGTSTTKIELWEDGIDGLLEVWRQAFAQEPPALQRKLEKACRHYKSWEIAALINQSAKSPADRFKALAIYVRRRKTFKGIRGKYNAVVGLAKLFTPELLKRPLRRVLIYCQTAKV